MTMMTLAWLGVSILYLLGSVYIQTMYRDSIPTALPSALFLMGSAIFLLVNRSSLVLYGVQAEVLVLALLVLAWVLVMWGIRSVARGNRRRVHR